MRGRGFAPGEQVRIALATEVLAELPADDGGAVALRVRIPADTVPGTYRLRAKGLSSGLVAGAWFIVRTNWSMFRFDLAHTGSNPYEHQLSPATVSDLEVAWAAPVDSAITLSSPAVVDGVVYVGGSIVGNEPSRIYAFEAATGDLIWKTPRFPWTAFESSPAVAGARLFIVGGDHAIHAFDVATGDVLWERSLGSGFGSSPVVAHDMVYVGGQGLYALDPDTGDIVWHVRLEGSLNRSPAVVGDTVYVGNEGRVYAFRALTGDRVWSRALTSGIVFSAAAVQEGKVFVGIEVGRVDAFDASNGRPQWSAPTGDIVVSSPAVWGGQVFIGSTDGHLYAMDADTGEALWATDTGGYILSSAAAVNGVVYVGSKSHSVFAIDAMDGEILWRYQTGSEVWSSPVVTDGTVYIGSRDKHIYAFRVPAV